MSEYFVARSLVASTSSFQCGDVKMTLSVGRFEVEDVHKPYGIAQPQRLARLSWCCATKQILHALIII